MSSMLATRPHLMRMTENHDGESRRASRSAPLERWLCCAQPAECAMPAGLDTCGPEGRRHNDLMPSSAKLMAATCIKRSDVWDGASSRVRRPTLDGRTDSPS